MNHLNWLLAVVAAAGAVAPVCAQVPPQKQGEATLTILEGVTVERTLRLSGAVRVRVEVVGPAPLVVQTPDVFGDAFWEVEPGPAVSTVLDAAKNLAVWRQEFTLQPLQPQQGEHPLAVPGLRFKAQGDEDWRPVTWEPVVLRVLTEIAKADVGLAEDITNVEAIPDPVRLEFPWAWALGGGGAVVLAALGWLAWRRGRRPAPEAAEAAALRALDALGQPEAEADLTAWFRQVTQVLRSYLERRYQLPATRRTTAELLAALEQGQALTEAQAALVADLLGRGDLAKFARVAPDAAECRAAAEQTRALVEQTATAAPATSAAS